MTTRFDALLAALAGAGVEFVLIGGVAANIHGSARTTTDLDVAYRRTSDNAARLADALAPHRPYLRGAPAGLPFVWEARTVALGTNCALTTDLGDLDLLGEVTGGGSFDDLVAHSTVIVVLGTPCRVLDLDWLIRVKRAAGRPKDLEAIAELELILQSIGED